MSTLRKGDIGATIIVTIVDENDAVLDISTATTKQLKFEKGTSRTVVTQTAVFTTDGTDGKVEYVTVADDLDELGLWYVQPHIILAAGDDFHGAVGSFTVSDVLV